MDVTIVMKEPSKTLEHKNVKAGFSKGGMYCVILDNMTMVKYPLNSIEKVSEVGGKPNPERQEQRFNSERFHSRRPRY